MSRLEPPENERELAARIHAGDRDAFEMAFRTYYPGLVGFAARLVGSREVAEELVQDIFLKIWVRRDQLAVAESIRTYLYRATRNQALNHLRRRRIERAWWMRQPREEPAAPPDPPIGADADQEALLAAVRAAVARLPDRCRQVFLLSREQNLTYAEIAAVMGISIKTVETQMGRALKALRATTGRQA